MLVTARYYTEKEGKLPVAVVVVNLYGQSADMDKILDICDKYNVPVIEYAAEFLGALCKGKESGTFGRLVSILLMEIK